MKGSVLNERSGESVTVAVKAVKRNVGVLYFKALLSELKIMVFHAMLIFLTELEETALFFLKGLHWKT